MKSFQPTPLAERSEEVQELVTRMPGWMVRSGTIVVLLCLVGLFFFAWEIQYPEIVPASFSLTTANAPKAIFTRTDGKLIKLFVHEGDEVKNGEVLAYLESTANPPEVLQLDTQLTLAYKTIKQGKLEDLKQQDWPNFGQLGELQPAFQTFNQSLVELKAYLDGNFYSQKKNILEGELRNLQALAASLKKQQQLQEQDRKLAMEQYKTQQKLADEKVIAPVELKQEESRKIARMLPYEQTQSALIENEGLQQSKQNELLELTNQVNEHRNVFIQRLNTLISAINDWKTKYIIMASPAGRIYFSGVLQENQFVNNRQQLFYIAPLNNNYFGELYVPQLNFGRVKAGQVVLIKFAGYPFEQYGYVKGKISAIASIPVHDSVYLAKVVLPDGLTTTYNRKLVYRSGLSASADIVTDDMNLLQRLFYSLRRTVAER